MKIRLLPSDTNGRREIQYLTSLSIDRRTLIDAGSAGFALEPRELALVENLFISHSHMDHIASLPQMLDSCLGWGLKPPTIWAGVETIAVLKEMIFNDRIWPDFLSLESNGKRLVEVRPAIDFEPILLQGLTVTPIPVSHVIPTQGYLLETAEATVLVSSDTGPTVAFWDVANRLDRLDAVILEVSFANDLALIAEMARHLTPRTFAQELTKLKNHEPAILAVHLKPWSRAAILEELATLGLKALEIMESGVDYDFPGSFGESGQKAMSGNRD